MSGVKANVKVGAEFNSQQVRKALTDTVGKTKLTAKLDGQFSSQQLRVAMKAALAKAPVTADLRGVFSDAQVREAVQSTVRKASAGADVKLEARLEDADFKTRLAAATGNRALEIKAELNSVKLRGELARVTENRHLEVEADLDAARLRAELVELTRKRHIEVDVDKSSLSGLSGAVGGISSLFGAASSGVSGFGAAMSAAGSLASTLADAAKGVASQVKGLSAAAGGGEEAVGGFAAAMGEAAASAGVVVVIAAVAGAVAAVTVAVAGAAAAITAFVTAALLAGAVMSALAATASVLAGAVIALPAVLFGAAGAFGVLAAAILPVAEALSAYTALQKSASSTSQKLAKTSVDNAIAIRDAKEQIRAASESFTNAQASEKVALLAVTDAVKEAKLAFEDLKRTVRDQADTEEEARIRVARAEKALALVQDRETSDLDRRQAVVDLSEAQHNLSDVLTNGVKVHADFALAQKKGINGAKNVVAAQRQATLAHQSTVDAQRAQAKSVQHLADVQRNQTLAAAGANTQLGAYQDALAKLSPAGQAFTHSVEGLLGVFQKLAQSPALDPLFKGLTAASDAVSGLLGKQTGKGFTLGPLGQSLKEMGGAIGAVARSFGDLFRDSRFVKDLTTLMSAGAQAVKSLGSAAVPLLKGIVSGFADLAKVSGPVVKALFGGFAKMGPAIKLFFDALAQPGVVKGATAGMSGFFKIINGLLPILGKFVGKLTEVGGPVLDKLSGPLLDIFSSLGTMLTDLASGGLLDGFVSFVRAVAVGLRELAAPGKNGVSIMTDLSKAFGDVLVALGPVVVQLVKELAPHLPALVRDMGKMTAEFLGMLPALIPMIPQLVHLADIIIKDLIPHLPELILLLEIWVVGLQVTLVAVDALLAPLSLLKTGFLTVRDAVRDAVRGITSEWSQITAAIGGPIQDAMTQYLNPFIQGINDILRKVGINVKIPTIAFTGGAGYRTGFSGSANALEHGRAAGGILPGYSPGIDNMMVPLSGGEGILRPEVSRVAPEMIHGLNRIARTSGVQGVRNALGYADGGIVGSLKKLGTGAWNFATDTAGQVAGFLTNPGGFLAALAKPLLGASTGGTDIGKLAVGGAQFTGKQLISNIGSVLFGSRPATDYGPVNSAALLGHTPSTDAIVAFARGAGIPFNVTSTFRRGSRSLSGGLDYHSQGLAVDMASSPQNMVNLARYFQQFTPDLLELIHSGGGGFGVKNGRNVGLGYFRSEIPGHYNHVHVAATLAGMAAAQRQAGAKGGVKLFDRGGAWKPGQLGFNGGRADETVLPPAESKALKDMAGGGGRPIEVHYHGDMYREVDADLNMQKLDFLARRLG